MSYQNLIIQNKNSIAQVTINREKALNALNADLLKEIRDCFSELSQNREVRVVIITGAGDKAFVAGADIAAMSQMNASQAKEFGGLGHQAMDAIDHCAKPVIAAVNGFCLGGGMELALSCDFIYASEKAKLGLPEVNLGLFPGWGGTQRLARLIGKGRAKEIIFSAKVLTAQEAFTFGIVNKVCPPESLLSDVKTVAAEICKKGPVAVSLAKQSINKGFDLELAEGLRQEREAFPRCFETEDLKEGLKAFLEKRPAKFEGR
ncbi:MAG: enoyl-CoA hydratase-related protein [Deltaproteobacteria bacterium]|nr:enoyl-CoA hydratase-related protein [Deltaproteobacteria bacterium]